MKTLFAMLVLFACGVAAAWQPGDEAQCPKRGVYENDYGFHVVIPAGLRGCPNSPIGMSDHGVMILLDKEGVRTIDVFGAYNGPLYGSLREATDAQLDYLQSNRNYEHVSTSRRTQMVLGGLKAERVVVTYRVRETGVDMTNDSIEALRCVGHCDEAPSHMYSVSLTSPTAIYAADIKVLEAVLGSWKKIQTGDGP